MVPLPLPHPYEIADQYSYLKVRSNFFKGTIFFYLILYWDDVLWTVRMQLNNANNWAHRANRCNALHSDEPAGRTSVTETLIVCNKSQSNKQAHAQIYTEKNTGIYSFCYRRPRDGPVDEALIKHQTEIASWISIDWSPGYLKTSYFGRSAQWPLFACVCRG